MYMDYSIPIYFIVCCPRSGSTWLRFLLNDHPDISCGPEFAIFSDKYGISNMIKCYRNDKSHVGFSRAMSEEKFISLVRNFCIEMYQSSAKQFKPSARIIVDKSPEHTFFLNDIRYIFPNTKFIFLIRDPRDTSISLYESAKSWANGIFPKSVIESIDMWIKYNEQILKQIKEVDSLMIHYEDIINDTSRVLSKCYKYLGAETLCKEDICNIIKKNSFNKLKKLNWHEGNFFRKGESDQWQKILSDKELTYYEQNAKKIYEKIIQKSISKDLI